MRKLFTNLGVLLGSCLVGLSLCEVSLRLFYPKYREVAEGRFVQDQNLIWARKPNSRTWYPHPDTGVLHAFHHNNLALRQHRNFSTEALTSAINIGFFGDSYTENVRMGAPYSFTEPLDYLLNRSGNRFNVLNLGVDGYGPGQSFLRYENFSHAEDLDYVFFVYCHNDLQNIYETDVFQLDDAGQLVRNEPIRSSWWRSLVSRLHISYLILDGRARYLSAGKWPPSGGWEPEHEKRVSEYEERSSDTTASEIFSAVLRSDPENDDLKRSLAIFRQLISLWKQSVEKTGGRLHAVLLPERQPDDYIIASFEKEQIDVVNLYECFHNYDSDYMRSSSNPYSFRNDSHWNEVGNRLVAICLYRFLEEKVGRSPLPENELQEMLDGYYSAFASWIPGRAEKGKDLISQQAASRIREKYLETEIQNITEQQEEIAEADDVVSDPNNRIIQSDWDVYLDGKRLVYVKDDCDMEDQGAYFFFLHITPVDKDVLSEVRFKHGFEERDSYHPGLKSGGGRCVMVRQLPDYAIRHIKTGQSTGPSAVPLWVEEFTMEQGAAGVTQRTGN